MRPAEEVRAEAAGDWVTAPVDALEARVRLLATAAASLREARRAVEAGWPRADLEGDREAASREEAAAAALDRAARQADRAVDALRRYREAVEAAAAAVEDRPPAPPAARTLGDPGVDWTACVAPAGDRS